MKLVILVINKRDWTKNFFFIYINIVFDIWSVVLCGGDLLLGVIFIILIFCSGVDIFLVFLKLREY